MKILFLTSSMGGGGAERVAALLANSWVEADHAVTLLATYSGRGDCAYHLNDKVNMVYLADLVKKTTNKFIRLKRLRGYFKETKPDVIISFLPDVNVATILAAKNLDPLVFVSERNYPEMQKSKIGFVTKFLRKRIYGWADGVIAQTNETALWVEKNCPNSELFVIPNPCVYPLSKTDATMQVTDYVAKNKKIIIGVGRFAEEKRFDILIEAFGRLSKQYPDWNLVILGEGHCRNALEIQIEKLGLTDSVLLPGFTGNLDPWYRKADIYVNTSEYEGFPNTLLEAMAYGVSSISFDINAGPRDIIEKDISGLLLPDSNHVDGLSVALEELMKNEELRTKLSKNAIAVRQRYSISNILAMWEDVISGPKK